jgi:electron transport complex protein RnfE
MMGTIREVFGSGSWLGYPIPVLSDNNISILTMAPGGFFVFGLLIALVNKLSENKPKKHTGCAGCPSAELCKMKKEVSADD